MPVTLLCQICTKPFHVDPYRQKTALYCSNTCRGKGLSRPETTALCAQCGTPFVVKRGARLCSTPCRRLSQSAKNSGKGLVHFWSKVQQCGHEWACPYCCWEWGGAFYETGYGYVQVAKRKILAHRLAWQLWHGQRIPASLVIAHYCHARACVNPAHLHAGTQKMNMADSVRDARQAFGERQGHSKLTDVTATEALSLYAHGWTIASIAVRFGVGFATAQSLCRGETWKHLPRPPMPRPGFLS
jgi:HNH endonuclease